MRSKYKPLSDQIEAHCQACPKLGSSLCENGRCFFAGCELARPDLGSDETYRRAFAYLNKYKVTGFKAAHPFGNRLEIGVSR